MRPGYESDRQRVVVADTASGTATVLTEVHLSLSLVLVSALLTGGVRTGTGRRHRWRGTAARAACTPRRLRAAAASCSPWTSCPDTS
jgi:hypothetical protein